MLKNPSLIQCSECGFHQMAFAFWNGQDEEIQAIHTWSNGKRTFFPNDYLGITKCIHCQAWIWKKDCSLVHKEIPFGFENVHPYTSYLTGDEITEALELKLFNNHQEEKHLRLFTWWNYNEKMRDDSSNVTIHTDGEFIEFRTHYDKPDRYINEPMRENLNRLLVLLGYREIDTFIKAEIYRQFGNFKESISLLNHVTSKELFPYKQELLEWNHQEIPVLKKFRQSYKDDLLIW